MTTIDLSTTNTIFADADARLIAGQVARGDYQRSLLAGSSRWSGADLEGAAARWSARYRQSRQSLLAALRAAGLSVVEVAGRGGRRVMVVGSEPFAVTVRYTAKQATATVEPAAEGALPVQGRRLPTTRRAGTEVRLVG